MPGRALEPECIDIPECVDRGECDGFGCVHLLDTNACLIEGRCYAPDATDDIGCMVCDPRTPLEWMPGDDEGACNNVDLCKVESRCGDGVCVGKPRDCDDELDCTLDSCEGGLCIHNPNDTATCSVDDACQAQGVCDGEICTTALLNIDLEDNGNINSPTFLSPAPPIQRVSS